MNPEQILIVDIVLVSMVAILLVETRLVEMLIGLTAVAALAAISAKKW